jgi:Helix-turn-helix domain
MKQLLTTEQIAVYLQVSVRTLATWRDEGMPHIAITARSYRYDIEKVKEWLDERAENMAADRAFDYLELSPSGFALYNALMDGGPPETWDPAEIRRRFDCPMHKMPEHHRIALDEHIIARWVEMGGDEQDARERMAVGKRIIAAHERESAETIIKAYEREKFGEE